MAIQLHRFPISQNVIDAKGDLLVGTADDTAGRLAVGAEGSILRADPAQTTGIAWVRYPDWLGSESLATGQYVPSRRLVTTTVTAVSQTLHLAYFTADKSESINTITVTTGSTAAAATPTLIRYAVYSVAANGDITLVASTANDTTLLASTNTSYPKALSATWSKVAGTRYAVGMLVVSGATMPSLLGVQWNPIGAMNTIVRLDPPICGRVTGQSDLPSSVVAGSIVGFQQIAAYQLS